MGLTDAGKLPLEQQLRDALLKIADMGEADGAPAEDVEWLRQRALGDIEITSDDKPQRVAEPGEEDQ